MTTKPHPTDVMEMPPNLESLPIELERWAIQTITEQRIKAYDLGRQEALEEAAKHFSAKGYGREMFIGEIEDELRSLKS